MKASSSVLLWLCLMWFPSKGAFAFQGGSRIVTRITDRARTTTTSISPYVLGNFAVTGTSCTRRRTSTERAVSIDDDEVLASGYRRPTVNWYPGHIAKAERQLAETLKAVDVVVEVRDARACKATSHQKVAEWCAGTPRIVVLTHVDLISKSSIASWKQSYQYFGAGKWDGHVNAQIRNQAIQNQSERNKHTTTANASTSKTKIPSANTVSLVEDVLFMNAKNGQGIHALHRAIFKAGAHVQERRAKRGLKDRALRVGIIGYPNVGKSALINRILGRKRAKTENTPGVTRSLQWIRVRSDDATSSKGKDFELLDSPGVIPAKLLDQSDAVLLAACNCIGDAAYDNQAVAAYLFEWIQALHIQMKKGDLAAPEFAKKCQERYAFNPLEMVDDNDENSNSDKKKYLSGEDMLFKIANDYCHGSPEDAARKMLQDFRTGRLGPICLQLAPESAEDEGQLKVSLPQTSQIASTMKNDRIDKSKLDHESRLTRARAALETAQKQGLGLPPMIQVKTANGNGNDGDENDANANDDVGKGLFEGW